MIFSISSCCLCSIRMHFLFKILHGFLSGLILYCIPLILLLQISDPLLLFECKLLDITYFTHLETSDSVIQHFPQPLTLFLKSCSLNSQLSYLAASSIHFEFSDNLLTISELLLQIAVSFLQIGHQTAFMAAHNHPLHLLGWKIW